jgi:hypothetical protein
MSDVSILAQIDKLREHPAYQAAEALRRGTAGGAAAMAKATKGSDEQRAALLLLSTWQTIGVMVSAMRRKDSAYRQLPVCHMYRELKAAIEQLADKDQAVQIQRLYDDYEAWLEARGLDATYVSALCGGLHARFG